MHRAQGGAGVALAGVALSAAATLPCWAATQPAELVLTDARIYTSTPAGFADTLAARDGRARMLGRDQEIGSLEPGASADFVILDRDIIALADGGRADDIAATRVRETWFRGRRVYKDGSGR